MSDTPTPSDLPAEGAAPAQEAPAPETAAEPVPAAAPSLPDWLAPIAELAAKPLSGEDVAGTKLFDQTDYEELDAEIKKPQSMKPEPVDWSRVDALAKSLLETTSKDIKVAGFLCVAAIERLGGKGHAVAGVVLSELGKGFGKSLWPRRKRARAGAIDWMGERLVQALDKVDGRKVDGATLAVAAERSRAAHTSLSEAFAEDGIEELRHLRKWADGLEAKAREAERAAAAPARVEARATSGGGDAAAGPATIESPADARAALTASRKTMQKAAKVLRDADPTDAAPWRILRFAEWPDRVAFEIGPDGATPIPMLEPAAAEAQLQTFESERDEGVLGRIEALFTERPFWLDLQRVLAQTMEAFGPRFDSARAAVEGATLELLARAPRLAEATFASGVPLASAATRAWLGGLGAGGGQAAASPAADAVADDPAAEIEAQARAAAARGDLRGALQAYQEGIGQTSDPKARFRLRLGLAQVCVGQGHAAIAVPHLTELRADLARLTVGEWAPELAIEVLATTVEACRKEAKAAGKTSDFHAQAAEALGELSRLDPLRALELD